jgi:peptidoglycan-N-acetylglucosamine deacetylase
MYKFRFLILWMITLLMNISCTTDEEVKPTKSTPKKNIAGVVLTFDDDYVDEWFNVNIKLAPYDWKGTFYVTHFDKLTQNQIHELKYLQEKGSEIAAHGLNHVKTVDYIKQNGADKFISDEITPMIDLMKKNGFNPTDFSYPYGNRDNESDQLLLTKFQTIRGTTYGNESPEVQNCYYNQKPLIYGLGLDNSYPHFNLSYYLTLLQYAKENNKIVIFYAHKTVPKSTGKYETEFNTLEQICKFVKTNNMKFYTVSDLHKL